MKTIEPLSQFQLELGQALLTFGVFLIFLCGGYFLVRRNLARIIDKISTPLEMRVSWLTHASRSLDGSVHNFPAFEAVDIEEVRALDSSLAMFVNQIKILEKTVAKANFDKGQIQMAEQFAHSTKGSLGLLRLRIKNAQGLSDAERDQLNEAVSQVSKASKNLLKKSSSFDMSLGNEEATSSILDILKEVVQNQKELLGEKDDIQILIDSEIKNDRAVKLTATDLATVFNNILENSVEAVRGVGHVKIKLGGDDATSVEISDDGCGIPAEILPKLMNERATFGKQDGTGLGLYHSRLIVEKVGGRIEVESSLTNGTTVRIHFPHTPAVVSDKIALAVQTGGTLVVVDDHELIHDAVDCVLKDQTAFKRVHLRSADEFESWFAENGPGEFGSRTYWMDHDLGRGTKTGLTLIENHSLQLESYLITGRADEPSIKKKAAAASVKLISKSEISKIQFVLNPSTDIKAEELDTALT